MVLSGTASTHHTLRLIAGSPLDAISMIYFDIAKSSYIPIICIQATEVEYCWDVGGTHSSL